MKSTARFVLGVLLLCVVPAQAALAADFYDRMMVRGAADTQAGNYEAAMRELRIAAFGFVEVAEKFQTAYVYLAVASMRNFNEAEARNAALRVVTSERLTPTYASLQLPAAIRAEFEKLAERLLTSAQMASLRDAERKEDVARTPGGSIDTPPDTAAPTPPPDMKPIEQAPAAKISSVEIPGRLTEAEAALAKGDLAASKKLYRTVLEAEELDHGTALRLAEGLYRSRDFEGALRAFARAGAILKGEEYLRYYRAVSMFETGDYANAKLELAEALPHIEITPDVAQYRDRIESARY
jgi:hypothetical protein